MDNDKRAGDDFAYTDERFADIQMLRYKADGFERLDARQKALAYCLSEAALWGRDILFDQNCRHNLKVRKVLEAVLPLTSHDGGGTPRDALVTYV